MANDRFSTTIKPIGVLEVPHVRDETEPETDHPNVWINRIEELKGEPGSR
jgi:hypothetical protein